MPEDRRSDVAKWPRERVAAAIAYARSWGAVPSTPMHADPNAWLTNDANVVYAADEILRAIAKERLTRGNDAVQSAQERHELAKKELGDSAGAGGAGPSEALDQSPHQAEAGAASGDVAEAPAHGLYG